MNTFPFRGFRFITCTWHAKQYLAGSRVPHTGGTMQLSFHVVPTPLLVTILTDQCKRRIYVPDFWFVPYAKTSSVLPKVPVFLMTQRILVQQLKLFTEACVREDIEFSQHLSETDMNAGWVHLCTWSQEKKRKKKRIVIVREAFCSRNMNNLVRCFLTSSSKYQVTGRNSPVGLRSQQ